MYELFAFLRSDGWERGHPQVTVDPYARRRPDFDVQVGRALLDYVAQDGGKIDHQERVSADCGLILSSGEQSRPSSAKLEVALRFRAVDEARER